MTETRRQLKKIRHVLAEHLIPETAEFGEVFCARDTAAVWYATRSGVVVNLTALLNAETVHAPVRHGRDGVDGVGIKGDKGDKGDAGRDAINGKDGIGYAGAVGPQGRPGKDCQCKLELAEQTIARLEKNLSESCDAIATVRREFADLKLVVEAIHGQNKQCDEYIAYLRNRKRN